MGIKQNDKLDSQTSHESGKVTEKDNAANNMKVKSQDEIVKAKVGAEAELPFIEKFVYFCVYSYFLAIAVHKIYRFPLGEYDIYSNHNSTLNITVTLCLIYIA